MSTAAEIITRIRNWSTSQDTAILTPTELLAIMNDLAKEAVDENDIWFCFGSGTTTVTSGERTASLPERLVRPVTVFIDRGSSRSFYKHLSYEEFLLVYFGETDVSAEGLDIGPHYTLYGTEMWFGPTPGANATVTVEGLYYAQDLHLSTNPTNLFTEHAESYLLFATMERLTKFKFEEESRLGLFEQEKKKALNRMRAHGDLQENLARRAVSRRAG